MNDYRQSRSRIAALGHAFSGLWYTLRTQPNVRIHALATVMVIALAAWLKLERRDWALVLLAVSLVWITEFINTAMEATVNLASPTIHPLARKGKDVCAAAVLIAAITSVILGLLILGPPLWARLIAG